MIETIILIVCGTLLLVNAVYMFYRLFATMGIGGFGITMHLLSFGISAILGIGSFMAIGKVGNYKITKANTETVQVTDSIPDVPKRDTIFLESPMPVCQIDSFVINGDTFYLKLNVSPKFTSTK